MSECTCDIYVYQRWDLSIRNVELRPDPLNPCPVPDHPQAEYR